MQQLHRTFHEHRRPDLRNIATNGGVIRGMKAALVIAALLLSASSVAADSLDRLRNASANELCWDTVRGFAREKYPSVKLGGSDGELTPASFAAPAVPPGPSVKESRKNFPGIRTC
jgi:hypothetical protein